ncbi:MAG: hypothetical protein AB1426_12375 [Bacillota bacterium]
MGRSAAFASFSAPGFSRGVADRKTPGRLAWPGNLARGPGRPGRLVLDLAGPPGNLALPGTRPRLGLGLALALPGPRTGANLAAAWPGPGNLAWAWGVPYGQA